jgi:hypothetical protein
MKHTHILLVMLASVSLVTTCKAYPALADEPLTAVHDVERAHDDERALRRDTSDVERDIGDAEHIAHDATAADRETDSLFHDALTDDGILHDDDKVREDDERAHERIDETKQLECDRLEFEYYLRHPPGTKPESLGNLHGCALYRADAHYHDTHPNIISVLGDNIDLMP